MADSSKKIKVDALNFDEIRTNLRTYLQGQNQFKDYNFDGSSLSVLLDILAYNTHYNALYNNMAVNEMFIDSASKRNSVVSIAKMLGYLPASAKCSSAKVTLTVSGITTANDQLILPAKTSFVSNIDGVQYTFMNTQDIITNYSNNRFTFSNVTIIEGKFQTQKYIVQPTAKFYISNLNCDVSTLKVYVNDSSGTGDAVAYSLSDNILNLNGSSKVYFLKEIEDGLYEVYFGDGALGKKLENGNLVTLTYYTTSGEAANYCKYFSVNLGSQFGTTSVRTISSSIGGKSPESTDSIRFNAPRAYSMQNRAVTEEDYRSLIYRYYPNAQTVNVWGGEENSPPVYGKVYISIKPKDDDYLDVESKAFIKNSILMPKSVVTTSVEIIDPEYINVELNTTVYYNSKLTNQSADFIKTKVASIINNYNNTDLLKFDGMFRFSKLSRLIDTCDKSIQSNITTVVLRRELTPQFDISSAYTVSLGNPIYYSGVAEDSLITTGFYIPSSSDIYYIKDDGAGKLVAFYRLGATDIIIDSNVGSVNYKTGLIKITSLTISALAGNTFEFIVKPQSNDVVSVRNQIVRIPTQYTTVKTLVDPISSGSSRGGSAYVFTPSR